MPELAKVYPTPLDLTRYSESTRQVIYSRLGVPSSLSFSPIRTGRRPSTPPTKPA